jgi:hypothetical protein
MRRFVVSFLALCGLAVLMLAVVALNSPVTTSKQSFTRRKPIAKLLSSSYSQASEAGLDRLSNRASQEANVRLAYGRFPLSFELNQGQTDARVRFLSHGRGYSLFLTAEEAVLALRKSNPRSNAPSAKAARGLLPGHSWLRPTVFVDNRANRDAPPTINAVLRIQLLGANAKANVTGVDELPGMSNYFIGNDPKKWRTNVPNYAKVKYANIYPGVDLVYHGSHGQLEYDLGLAPGADPYKIRVRFEGANQAQVNSKGELILHTPAGDVYSHRPVIYQLVDGHQKIIRSATCRRIRERSAFGSLLMIRSVR